MTLLTPRPARDPAAPLSMDMATPIRLRTRPRPDFVLLVIVLALALIGAVLVWAATRDELIAAGGDPQSYLYRHLLNIVIGAVLLYLTSRLDSRLLRLIGPVLYVLSLIGLLAVFVVGSTVNGAHAWIRLGGGFEIQPAEFMKLGLIVGMSVMFAARASARAANTLGSQGSATPLNSDVVFAVILAAVPLGLVMLQPDLGSAMVLAAAAFGVLIAAGVPARWTIGLVVLTVLGAIVAVKMGMLAQYQLARFSSFTHPERDPQNTAYNITQAHIAIAHGGIFGQGLFHGAQTNGGFVPEQQTDFVFSVAGEEFGFVGASVVIVLFGLLCWRALRIAARADVVGRLVACGVVSWLAFQAFQNIGMNLGLTPVTGLPLPFVSYGGSSMFAQGIAIGLLLAIDRQSCNTSRNRYRMPRLPTS